MPIILNTANTSVLKHIEKNILNPFNTRRPIKYLLNASLVVVLLMATQWLTPSQVFANDTNTKNEQELLILTSLPLTYFLTSALLTDTPVKVQNLPKRGRRMNGQGNFFKSRADSLADTFKSASAVVTIGKLWRDDPLFTAARGANIRIIDIDATKPWSNTLEGISVAMTPHQDSPWATSDNNESIPSIFFWLSLTNSVRSADIIAQDLMRLAPQVAAQIQTNLSKVRSRLLNLQRQNESALLSATNLSVFSLAPELVYLTSDLSLFVDGSFYKQDIEWTDADIAGLEKYLKDNDVGVVLHKWLPAEPIQAAITRANAKLVVVDTLDAGIVEKGAMLAESYFTIMTKNLENLRTALLDSRE